MRKIIFALACVATLGGCAEIQKLESVYQVASSAQVTPKQIYIAAQTFDGLQATATNYLIYCKPRLTEAICSADNRRLVIRSVRAGRASRNQLETYITQNTSAPVSVYNALLAAIDSLNNSAATKVSQ